MGKHVKELYMYILGAVIVISIMTLLVLLVFYPIPDQNKETLIQVIGTLTGAFVVVVGYFYGSSKSSADKTEIMDKQATEAIDAKKIVPLILLAFLLTGSLQAQVYKSDTDSRRSHTKTIGTGYDSVYVKTTSKIYVFDFLNNTTDTVRYCFVSLKADTSTVAIYILPPGISKHYDPFYDPDLKAILRKSTGSSTYSILEQY